MKKLFFMSFLIIPLFVFSDDSRLIEIKTIDQIEKEVKEEIESKENIKKEDVKEEAKDKESKEKKDEDINTQKRDLFDGKLNREDIFVQEMDNYYIIWIKKKEGVNSVGFVTEERYTNKKLRYFLRAEKIIFPIDNRLKYKDKIIENDFLINSEIEKNRLLGESFKLFLPKKVIIGYNSFKRDLKINENTGFIIRTFSEPFGSGKFFDNNYRISLVYNPKDFKRGLNLIKKNRKDSFYILEFSYFSDTIDIIDIGIESNNYIPLIGRVYNDAKIIIYNWGYKPGKSMFFINFFVLFKTDSEFYIVLKKDKDDIKFKVSE